MIGVRIVGESGKGVAVSESGELIVGPVAHSRPVSITQAAGVAKNFFSPVPGKQYVVTDILIATNKDIGVDGAVVQIYEADTAASTSPTKTLLTAQILKNDKMVLTGLQWEVTEGAHINATTDDDTVYVTIAAHLVEAHVDNPADLGVGADA